MLTYNCANALLKCLLGQSTSYSYSDVYLGLSTTAPSRDGTGYTEPSGNGYSRISLKDAMSNPALGSANNTEEVHFKAATGPWGTCTHYLLWSAKTGGVLLAYGQLTDEISPVAETVPIVPAGDIVMGLS